MKFKTLIKFIIFLVIASLPVNSYALLTGPEQTFSPAGLMNKMLNDLMGNTSTWHNVFVPAATSLFMFLSTTEFVFDTGLKLLRGSEVGKIVGFVILRLITIALFLYFIKNIDWIFQILDQYKEWASQAGSVPINYGPSEIAAIGVQISSNFFSAVTMDFTDILKNPELILLGMVTVFAGFAIMAAFGWAALQLFCIYVEFYLVVNAGIINLGFLGSSWTRDMGKRYFSYIIAVGTKLLVALLVVSAVQQETATWASQVILNKNDWSSMLNVMTMLMVDSLVIAVMVSSIPAYAAGIISGVSSANANQAFSTGMSMAGAAAATAGIVAGGAYMMYGAGKGAVGSAINAYRNSGGGALGDMSPGGASPTPPSSDGQGGDINSSNVEGSISGGSNSASSNTSGNSKPSAFNRGASSISRGTRAASNAHHHWSGAQSSNHVAPPDLRDKHTDL